MQVNYLIFIEFKSLKQRIVMIQDIRKQVKSGDQYVWFLQKMQRVLYIDTNKLNEVKKKQDSDDNNEDTDKDEEDEEEDDEDGDNDLKGVKQSDIQNQMSQYLVNVRNVIKTYVVKTKD